MKILIDTNIILDLLLEREPFFEQIERGNLQSYMLPHRPLIKIITLYEPNPQKWNDHFTQRRENRNDD